MPQIIIDGGRRMGPRAMIARSERPGQRLSFLIALGVILFYLASSLAIASRRPFWYDELSTVLIVRLPDCTTIWKALSEAVDSMPATYFLLVRLFDRAFGPSELGARIPSALALAAGLMITFDCARRLSDNLHALAALALLSCSLLPFYGYEARPYALYFMFVALGLWLWIHGPDTKSGAVLFGTAIFLGFAVHFYSALCLLPYLGVDATRTKAWRAPSTKSIAGVVGVLCGVALFSPQILAGRQYSRDFWAAAYFTNLAGVFGEFFPFGLFVAALALLWVAWMAKHETVILDPMLSSERVGWFFLVIPVAGYIAAKLVTNAFYNRYFIGMLPGLAIAFATALWRRFRLTPMVSAGIILIGLAWGMNQQISAISHASTIKPPAAPLAAVRMMRMLSLEAEVRRDGKTTIAVRADDILSLQVRYYSKHPEIYTFLLEPGMGVNGRINRNLARYTPMRFWTIDELRMHAKETALVDPSEGTLESMRTAGFASKPRNSTEVTIVYLE